MVSSMKANELARNYGSMKNGNVTTYVSAAIELAAVTGNTECSLKLAGFHVSDEEISSIASYLRSLGYATRTYMEYRTIDVQW